MNNFHFFKDKHKRAMVSSIALLIFGITTLTLWFINLTLFFQFAGYVATIFYSIDMIMGLNDTLEARIMSKERRRKQFDQKDQKNIRMFQLILEIMGIIEILILICFNTRYYYQFILAVFFYTGLFFTFWSYQYGIFVVQKTWDIPLKFDQFLFINLGVMVIAGIIMLGLLLLKDWVFFAFIAVIFIIERILNYRSYAIFKADDLNEAGQG